jgi:hypothetical protein
MQASFFVGSTGQAVRGETSKQIGLSIARSSSGGTESSIVTRGRILMKVGKLILPVVMLLAGMLASSTQSFATHEYTKKEKKACTYCHVAANSKELNEAGQ